MGFSDEILLWPSGFSIIIVINIFTRKPNGLSKNLILTNNFLTSSFWIRREHAEEKRDDSVTILWWTSALLTVWIFYEWQSCQKCTMKSPHYHLISLCELLEISLKVQYILWVKSILLCLPFKQIHIVFT